MSKNDDATYAVRVKEPGMKAGVLLAGDGTLVNRWFYAAALSRAEAEKVAASIRARGDQATLVRHRFQGLHKAGRS